MLFTVYRDAIEMIQGHDYLQTEVYGSDENVYACEERGLPRFGCVA